MQAIMEALFDIFYLAFVIIIGFKMIKNTHTKIAMWFAVMALLLGFGDMFHLVPRVIALFTVGTDAMALYLGLGKLITSITMTVFYLILFLIFEAKYEQKNTLLRVSAIVLAVIRIVLLAFPQNEWFVSDPNVLWGVYRNIPFALLGLLPIYMSLKAYVHNHQKRDLYYGVSIILSFAFYIPVVLFSNVLPIIGVLMIPKTIAYMIVIYTGYKEFTT